MVELNLVITLMSHLFSDNDEKKKKDYKYMYMH